MTWVKKKMIVCTRAVHRLEWLKAFVPLRWPLSIASDLRGTLAADLHYPAHSAPPPAPTSISRLCSWKVMLSTILKPIIQGTLRWFLLEKQGSAGGGNNIFQMTCHTSEPWYTRFDLAWDFTVDTLLSPLPVSVTCCPVKNGKEAAC